MVEKEDLDFVFIALPTYLHCEAAVYCLNHGVNVYTEKPMAITLTQCEMMIDAAEKNGKKLMVGQCLRFTGEYELLKELTENGKYGKSAYQRLKSSTMSCISAFSGISSRPGTL